MSEQEIGALAERLVKSYFESKGSDVQVSPDPFDGEKDLIIDGARTEVKFQTIYHKFKTYNENEPYKAFTVAITSTFDKVAQNQLDKCLNADRWIVVQNPSNRLGEKTVKIWEAPKLGERRFKINRNRNDGRIVAGFPLECFELLVDIDHEPLYNKIKRLEKAQFS